MKRLGNGECSLSEFTCKVCHHDFFVLLDCDLNGCHSSILWKLKIFLVILMLIMKYLAVDSHRNASDIVIAIMCDIEKIAK